MSHRLPAIDRVKAVMARLRDPKNGCPWDIEQNFATIAPYTIEEAYEVADAIERNASHIVTHKNVWPGVEARMLDIKAACDYREAQ